MGRPWRKRSARRKPREVVNGTGAIHQLTNFKPSVLNSFPNQEKNSRSESGDHNDSIASCWENYGPRHMFPWLSLLPRCRHHSKLQNDVKPPTAERNTNKKRKEDSKSSKPWITKQNTVRNHFHPNLSSFSLLHFSSTYMEKSLGPMQL
jgi:hypothetical protein